jgi:hypothetical protein
MLERILLKALVVPLFAILTAVSAAAADDNEADEHGVPVVAVDWASLHHTGALEDVWVTKSFPETITLGHETYPHRSQKLQYAIECADRTYALEQWVLTDGPDGTGNTVWADRAVQLDFLHAEKGTLEAAVVHTACELNPKTTVARTPRPATTLQ